MEIGIIEKVASDEIPQDFCKLHYLSHRTVLCTDEETTEIKAVFDGLCTSNGPSLTVFLLVKMCLQKCLVFF